MKKQQINLLNNKIFVTGAAGFIGANLVLELLRSVPSVQSSASTI